MELGRELASNFIDPNSSPSTPWPRADLVPTAARVTTRIRNSLNLLRMEPLGLARQIAIQDPDGNSHLIPLPEKVEPVAITQASFNHDARSLASFAVDRNVEPPGRIVVLMDTETACIEVWDAINGRSLLVRSAKVAFGRLFNLLPEEQRAITWGHSPGAIHLGP